MKDINVGIPLDRYRRGANFRSYYDLPRPIYHGQLSEILLLAPGEVVRLVDKQGNRCEATVHTFAYTKVPGRPEQSYFTCSMDLATFATDKLAPKQLGEDMEWNHVAEKWVPVNFKPGDKVVRDGKYSSTFIAWLPANIANLFFPEREDAPDCIVGGSAWLSYSRSQHLTIDLPEFEVGAEYIPVIREGSDSYMIHKVVDFRDGVALTWGRRSDSTSDEWLPGALLMENRDKWEKVPEC